MNADEQSPSILICLYGTINHLSDINRGTLISDIQLQEKVK